MLSIEELEREDREAQFEADEKQAAVEYYKELAKEIDDEKAKHEAH